MTPRTTAAGRRRLSRTPVYARRPRREIVEAVGAVVGVLAVTGFCIWAMRPGGIAGRQPRAIFLGLIVVAVLAIAWWLIGAPGRRFEDRRVVALAIAAAFGLGVAVVGAIVWPGGIVVDDPTPPTLVPDPITDKGPPPGAPPIETTPTPPGP